MRTSIYLAAALLVSVLPLSAQSTLVSSDANTIQKQIATNQLAIESAIHSRDFAALKQYWAPQMVVNGPDNRILTRDDVLAAMQHGGLNYSSLKGTVETFKIFGDTAVEMGHEDFVMAAGPSAGKPLQRRYTDVWQRIGEHWFQIARQATILNVDVASVYGPSPAPTQNQSH